MKTTFHLMALVLAAYLIGCRTNPATRGACYEYTAQILAIPSCAAKVEEIAPCYARLSTDDGRLFHVGSPGASLQVVGFVHSLEIGKTYYLPEAFMEYQKKQPPRPNKADAGDGK